MNSTPAPTGGSGTVFGIPLVGGITEGGAIILAVLGIILLALLLGLKYGNDIRTALRATRQEVATTRQQVENNHDTNLRDDLDGKHDDLIAGQRALLAAIQDIRRDVGGVREDIRGHTRRLDTIDSRLTHHIEGERP